MVGWKKGDKEAIKGDGEELKSNGKSLTHSITRRVNIGHLCSLAIFVILKHILILIIST